MPICEPNTQYSHALYNLYLLLSQSVQLINQMVDLVFHIVYIMFSNFRKQIKQLEKKFSLQYQFEKY